MVKKTIFTAILGLILVAGLALAWENMTVFWNDNPAKIKTMQVKGETYVSVPDMAKYFPGIILQDFKNNRLDFRISSTGPAAPNPTPTQTPVANVIVWGRAFYTQKDLEVPIVAMEVQIRKTRKDIQAALIPALFYSVVVNGNGDYLDLFPVVRKTITDESGIFIINDIPPGSYELTARFIDAKHILGWRWPLDLVKGNNLQFELSENTAMVRDKNERQ